LLENDFADDKCLSLARRRNRWLVGWDK